jgi:cell division septation protein DedD
MTLKRQSQFELFPSSDTDTQNRSQSALLYKDLTLSTENIIVISIILLMLLVVSFSFGVEKGRRIVLASLEKETPVVKIAVVKPIAVDQPKAVAPVVPVQAPAVTTAVKPTVSAQLTTQLPAAKPQIQPQPVQKQQELKEIGNGQFTVQVASFKSKDQAHREASILKNKGFDILVLAKGSYTVVCVGKFAKEEQAKKFISKLKSRYNDCLVRRL